MEKPDLTYYRCLCNIEKDDNTLMHITSVSEHCCVDVLYLDRPAEMNDLDFEDKMSAYDAGYNPLTVTFTHGSLWARQGEDLRRFWTVLAQIGIIPKLPRNEPVWPGDEELFHYPGT